MRKTLSWIGCAVLVLTATIVAQTFKPDIPQAWNDKDVEGFEVPLAQRDRSPRYLTAEQYYALKVRPIYRSYPAYAKGREPAGYLESLQAKEPEIIFDPATLHTKEDWIAAGKIVFESDTQFRPAREMPEASEADFPVASDGRLASFNPFYTYVIRKKGELEGGINSCAGCHTRVMPDGSFFEGGQGSQDPPATAADLSRVRALTPAALERAQSREFATFGAPWIMSREESDAALTKEELIRRTAAAHSGVLARQGTSATHPPHIPSLIGIQAHFGDFQPAPGATAFSGDEGTRYSDEQLYALALYIYSLKPPPNPNPFDDQARHGQQVFAQQGCASCHVPPLYTSNKLTPAIGYTVPEDLKKTDDILGFSVRTDPTLALKTRRGTGFYKVPSLRGVWFRNGFGHGGQADTLEEWLDPARLKDDYVPKGFHLGPDRSRGMSSGCDWRLPTNRRWSRSSRRYSPASFARPTAVQFPFE